ncbi:MAG: glycoside hydrolase family 2 [Bacillales bacterium]|jgi:beta-galactosidase/beta-glucuronidase|nr:glycoside hydrolase family 2 [Bacillales bacterium]
MKTAFLRAEYPRPTFKRTSWILLNGVWNFDFDDENIGLKNKYYNSNLLKQKINVPFAYQSKLSGINKQEQHYIMWYQKDFKVNISNKRYILFFNRVDYYASVYLNGYHLGDHEGGYSRFSFDITDYLKENNTLTVRVEDYNNQRQPRGKQCYDEPNRCWYQATSGIWQSVWIEEVGSNYFKDAKFVSDIHKNEVEATISTYTNKGSISLSISYQGKVVSKQIIDIKSNESKVVVVIKPNDYIDKLYYWSVNEPNLYDVTLELLVADKVEDRVETYFAFREIKVVEGRILLNDIPIYQKLVLDQGYFDDGDLTPSKVELFKKDIEYCQEFGFNGARKHQKIEDEYYYYYADILGFLVWAEMPSAYEFSSFEISKLSEQYLNIINELSNHPCIIVWVPLNESWGLNKILKDKQQQDYAKALYYLTKAIDKTRLISNNDGWEQVDETDIIGVHDYAKDGSDFLNKYQLANIENCYPMHRRLFAYGAKYLNQPLIMSEFGGITIQDNKVLKDCWGYNLPLSKEEFQKTLKNLIDNIKLAYFVGYCYTQLSDVKQEVNGLLDKDHNPKIEPKLVKDILK